MRLTRVYVDTELAAERAVDLPKPVAQHLLKVLRLRMGAPVVLFNGDGNDYPGVLESNVQVRLSAAIPGVAPAPIPLTLAQGLCRGERMDLVLQKATELGVSAIEPLNTQRSEVRLKPDRLPKRMSHWQQVIASACEQSGRSELPALHAPMNLPEWLAQLAPDPAQCRLVLDPTGDKQLSQLNRPSAVLAVVGPEGGFEDKEIALLASQGFQRLTLGPRVLRTETAGPALLAAAGALWGDLG